MKYVLSVISLIIGLFSDFLVFTPSGQKLFTKIEGYFEYNFSLFLSVVALIIAIYCLFKYNSKFVIILSILGAIANLIYLGYFIRLVIALG